MPIKYFLKSPNNNICVTRFDYHKFKTGYSNSVNLRPSLKLH